MEGKGTKTSMLGRREERRMSPKMAKGGEYLLLDDPPHT
jgi:hypothetical protein